MKDLYIGLMSGTSCDGVDGVIAEFSDDHRVTIVAYAHIDFDDDLRCRLNQLQQTHFSSDPFHLMAISANDLVDYYARVVSQLCQTAKLRSADITAIGCHGQTIRHHPQSGYSIQMNNPARLVEKTGIRVIADWRNRDIAAGGEGAPLVPLFHQWLFGTPDWHRVIINLGGIANLTDLSSNLGFDIGPANTLMDTWIMKHRHQPYDAGGDWAASGEVIEPLLVRLLSTPFFHQQPPKSTGRDMFSLAWLEGHLTGDEKPEDIQATLLVLTAQIVSDAVLGLKKRPDQIFLCGGGVYNKTLRQKLDQLLAVNTMSTAEIGLDPMQVEATAFAWLARQTLMHQPGNLPEVTGAIGPRVLGAIYPV